MFHPQEENPPPGKLFISTKSQSWEIELIGYGKEAVLIISKYAIEFADCILGNTYDQQISLKNVGDVNYPVQLSIEPLNYDLIVSPNNSVIDPYSDIKIQVSYSPSKSVKTQVNLKISSPYSDHVVPISLHSGTATIELMHNTLEFGDFERGSKTVAKLEFKNMGTVRTSYMIKHGKKPVSFFITNAKGNLPPKKSVEVTVTYIREEVGYFEETLVMYTDLVDKQYLIPVTGRCQASRVEPSEFDYINFGVCPVMKTSIKTIPLRNYGDFPLSYSVKFTYPLTAKPAFGTINGGEEDSIDISWNPSGSYELRTHLKLVTSCGSYIVTVHGRSSFPELSLRNQNIDFGVCGIGHTYKQTFAVVNKGKVPFQWAIPKSRDVFTVSETRGTLEPKSSFEVEVLFKPPSMGRFASSFVVECRGLSFKELFVNGVGGLLKFEVFPPIIDIGRSSCDESIIINVCNQGDCPCDYPQPYFISIVNTGDITLNLKFDYDLDNGASHCEIILPDQIVLKPRRKARCKIMVIARDITSIAAILHVAAPEKKISVPIKGIPFGILV
jgi:hypothetical protein